MLEYVILLSVILLSPITANWNPKMYFAWVQKLIFRQQLYHMFVTIILSKKSQSFQIWIWQSRWNIDASIVMKEVGQLLPDCCNLSKIIIFLDIYEQEFMQVEE